MALLVQKFGGSSVADADRMRNVADYIARVRRRGDQPVVVVSAMGHETDDLLDVRVKGALPRMEALQQVVDEHGVNFMATICAICKAQFTKVLPYYKFKMSMVGGVHQLVSTAIRLK